MYKHHVFFLALAGVLLSGMAFADIDAVGGSGGDSSSAGAESIKVSSLTNGESKTGGLSKSIDVFQGHEKSGSESGPDSNQTKQKAEKLGALVPENRKVAAEEEIKAAADEEGNISEKEVDKILNKYTQEMAQEKLSKLSQPSTTNHSGTTAKSSSGAAHGSMGGGGGNSSGSRAEAYQARTAPIQNNIKDYAKTLADYSATASLLSDSSLAKIQNSFIDSARNTLGMPRGKEKSLSDNFLFQSLNDESKNTLKDSFLGLVKNSATDKAPTADLPYLKDIVADENFQFTAEKILGAENLSYLNIATISADMLNIKSLTGATYASFLSLTEDTIPGAKASVNVSDWMQAADFLSSKTFLSSTRNEEFASLMRKGFSELTETYKRLGALKSLDYLDLLQKPMKADMKKLMDSGVISAIAALRQAKRLKARSDWDSGILSNFNYFQEHINEALAEAAKVNSSEQLIAVFDKILSNNSLRAYWRSFDYPGYFKYRRGVGGVYFSAKFKGFNEFKIAPQTAHNLAYGKITQSYPKDNALLLITTVAMDYVKSQKDRSRGLAELEKTKDEEYSVVQLVNDKYYVSLEDEKN